MAIQSNSQSIGSIGQTLVKYQAERSGLWVGREQSQEDFGIDLELELTKPEILGQFIKIQVKAHQNVGVQKGMICQPLKKAFLRYVNECRVPIILVVADVSKEECWAIWLQQYLIESLLTQEIYLGDSTQLLTVNIPQNNSFRSMLTSELVTIANWENQMQKYIALKDLAQLSVRLYDQELANLLYKHLERFQQYQTPLYIDEIINKVLSLGTGIWNTRAGHQIAQFMYDFIRQHGNQLKVEQICRFTAREDAYSRTGLIALGILYDQFPQHAISLKLPATFRAMKRYTLEVYCIMREKHPGKSSPHWLRQKEDHSTLEIHADFREGLEELYDKWANRGDSLFFDIVFDKT
jgi:hypothetical protein